MSDEHQAPLRIGLLEDDDDHAELIGYWLQDAGFEVRHSTSGETLIRELQQEGFDLLLFDWKLPQMTGIEVLRWVRRNIDWPIPILFLTAMDDEANIVGALEAGADDYVTKPARKAELLARIHAVARRSGVLGVDAPEMKVREFHFQRDNRVCLRHGEPVGLTAREFDLAWFMFSRRDQILSRSKILQAVWGVSENLKTRTIDTHMSRIRNKLSLRPEDGWRLSSVYHYGYRLEQVSG